ncbi:MAG: TonB-dependent receptor, partial [Hyphomicrobium sp.]|nr:TonB-dependent receptor [Hyphomicrobium sp.]
MNASKLSLASSRLALVAALGLAAVASPALAEDIEAAADAAQPAAEAAPEDDLHNRQTGAGGEIIVSTAGLKELDLLAGTSVVDIADVQRDATTGQIGE